MKNCKKLFFIISVVIHFLVAEEYYTPKESSQEWLTFSGELASANSTIISTPRHWGLSYQIVYLVKEGTYVSKGDTIVKFDPHEVQSDIKTVESELQQKKYQKEIVIEQNQNRIEAIERQIEQSKIQLQIYKNRLEQAQYSSENERKNVELDLKKAELSLEKQKQNLEAQKILNKNNLNSVLMSINQSRVRLQRQRRTLQDLCILAPRGGLVVHFTRRGSDIKIKKGDNVSPGWPITRIPDLENMIVEIDLNEVDRLKLLIGQPASLRIEAYPDTVFTGFIDYISKIVEFDFSRSYLKTYPMRVNIDSDINHRLKPGLTAKVKIKTGEYNDCYSIPSWCLYKPGANYKVKNKVGELIPVQVVKLSEGRAFVKGAIDSSVRLLPNRKVPNF